MVDASAAVEMLLHTSAGDRCLDAATMWLPAIAPGHFDAEVYSALRRAYLQRRIDRASLGTLVAQLSGFDAERVPLDPLLPGAPHFADVLGAHDVFYVLLAISRACPLLTCDAGLARAAARLGVEVIAIGPSGPA